MELATCRATVRGPIIHRMASVGYRASARIGPRIVRVNGCGYRPQVGRGCRASRGDGRHITTVGGLTFQDYAGPGYRASVHQTPGMVLETTIGVLRWFSFLIVRLLAGIMLDGTRWRRGSTGADMITGEEMTAPIYPLRLLEKVHADRATADLAFILLNRVSV